MGMADSFKSDRRKREESDGTNWKRCRAVAQGLYQYTVDEPEEAKPIKSITITNKLPDLHG